MAQFSLLIPYNKPDIDQIWQTFAISGEITSIVLAIARKKKETTPETPLGQGCVSSVVLMQLEKIETFRFKDADYCEYGI